MVYNQIGLTATVVDIHLYRRPRPTLDRGVFVNVESLLEKKYEKMSRNYMVLAGMFVLIGLLFLLGILTDRFRNNASMYPYIGLYFGLGVVFVGASSYYDAMADKIRLPRQAADKAAAAESKTGH